MVSSKDKWLPWSVTEWDTGASSSLLRGRMLRFRSYFLVYEYLVQRYLKTHQIERKDISPLWAVTFGAGAGFGLWFSCVMFFVLPALPRLPFSLSLSPYSLL